MEITIRTKYCIGDIIKTSTHGNLTVASIKIRKIINANASLAEELIEYQVFKNDYIFWISENDLMSLQKGGNKNERN